MTDTTDSLEGLTAEMSAQLDDLIRSLCFVRPPVLAPTLDLVGDLGYDSLGLLELITSVEADFGLESVDEQSALGVQTVGDLRRLLAESLA